MQGSGERDERTGEQLKGIRLTYLEGKDGMGVGARATVN
jgi:hypothetical protein